MIKSCQKNDLFFATIYIRVKRHMTSYQSEVERDKIEMLQDIGVCEGVGLNKCSGRQIFIFLTKENWISPMNRHHANNTNNTLLGRNPPFDSDVRQ